MFTVIEPVPCRRRFAEALRRERTPTLQRVPVPHGAPFYTLRIPYCGVFPWEPVQRNAVGVLLPPDDLHVPDDMKMHIFEPKRLPLLCLSQTVAQLLRQQSRKPLSLGVYDPNGALCGHTACLLSAAADVRIATDAPERFREDARRAMQTFGAALTVRRERAVLSGCDVIVCESTDGVPCAQTVYCLRQSVCRADAVRLSGFALPEEYAPLLPDGTDALTFASALFERCAAHRLSQCRFLRLDNSASVLYND